MTVAAIFDFCTNINNSNRPFDQNGQKS